MQNINEIIRQKLIEIETKENVKIIHAVESGSRAWGFASPDSDYDVRFIYVRPKQEYLKLETIRDVIEFQLDETLDINGWDLQKTLRLTYKSNPTVFEWSNSPIIYKTTPCFLELKEVIYEYFSCKSGLYHYLNTAYSNYREYLKSDMVKIKKYFYVIRPILACKWILDKKCPPPMLFTELMQAELESNMIPIIENLMELKKETREVGMAKRIYEINTYIEKNLEDLKVIVAGMDNDSNKSWKKLDEIFLKVL